MDINQQLEAGATVEADLSDPLNTALKRLAPGKAIALTGRDGRQYVVMLREDFEKAGAVITDGGDWPDFRETVPAQPGEDS